MKGIIDRLEGDWAVVLIKISELPSDVNEGDLLTLTIHKENKQTQQRKRAVKKALGTLFKQ